MEQYWGMKEIQSRDKCCKQTIPCEFAPFDRQCTPYQSHADLKCPLQQRRNAQLANNGGRVSGVSENRHLGNFGTVAWSLA